MAEYVERTALRDALYDADAITMQGVKILNQFPAADVAPVVHGRWIDKQEDDLTEGMWRCSACGEDFYFSEANPSECGANYCSACGAKMDGESSE